MHDAKGRALAVGDTVLMPFTVKAIHATEDYCNVDLVSVASLPGTESYTTLSAVNTQQTLRAHPGDELTFTVTKDGAQTRLS
jgi:hypothetical protein